MGTGIFILRAMELKYTGLKYKKAALFLVQPFALLVFVLDEKIT